MADHESGLNRAKSREHSNQPGGRSGSGTQKNKGPVKSAQGNPTKSGGINRPTKG